MNKIEKLYRIVSESVFFAALLRGVASAVEHEDLMHSFGKYGFQTIVDVGANRGQFALLAHKSFPNAKIFSFEPLVEPTKVFRQVFANDPRVILHETALGPNDEIVAIHVSRADDSSSLLPIASLQSELFPGTEEKEQRNVSVRRLSSILRREDIEQPALLKIDVQGFERDVLEGCRTLLPCFSHIYVECSFMELYKGQALAHEVVVMLDKCGFMLEGIYNTYYNNDGFAVQGDFLFKNTAR